MSDIFSKRKRGAVMAKIRSKDSAIERAVSTLLKTSGIRTRSHARSLPGHPDFYSKKMKFVIFADSCFWHGCRYHGSAPKTNRVFWRNKICRNKERDREVNREYRRMGWTVIRIWEHTLKNNLQNTHVSELLERLKNNML